MNKKKKILMFILLTGILLSLIASVVALAFENPYTVGSYGRYLYGGTYWTSSNIREWLNSNQTTVGYTNNPPSSEFMGNFAYDKEPGFLTNFSSKEQDAIAVTERRVWVQNMDSIAKDGGGGTTPHANVYSGVFLADYASYAMDYKNYGYKKENDKVFLITPYEVYWYLLRRGYPLKRPITPEAQAKNKVTTLYYSWWLQGGTQWQDLDNGYQAHTDNTVRSSGANIANGLTPAINIKPTYIFDDGRKASSLKIGDKVVFGKYLNVPIEWQVINISDTGYPMLLSTKVLDLKKYDSQGDQSKKYSEYIKFENPDVSLFNDVQYKSTTGMADKDIPTVKVLNSSLLDVRQNNSFTLEIEVSDSGSGIDYVIKPDGVKTTETSFTYTVDKNGKYVVKAMDKAGNLNEFLIPVSNINIEPYVDISASTSSNIWTNQNVNVNIQATNDVDYKNSKVTITNTGNFGGPLFPNYTTYMGKTFRISGTVSLISYKEQALNGYLGMGVSYRTRGTNAYTYTMGGAWVSDYHIQVRDLVSKGQIPFSFDYTVPGNYFENIQPFMQFSLNQSAGEIVRVEILDLKYELLDNSDFAVKSITLPNGQVVNQAKYTDVLSKEGSNTYNYSVLDNRGKVTTRSIVAKIDKTKPTLDLKYDTGFKKEVVVTVTGADSLSGVSKITLPDGSTTTSSSTSYKIVDNGSYNFSVTDNAGNTTTKTVSISNVDKTAPTISLVPNTTAWTSGNITLNVTATDSQSGVKSIKTPNGEVIPGNSLSYSISKNGTYNFEAVDNLGNTSNKSITISNIDTTAPEVNLLLNSSNWTNGSITITVNTSDTQSGIKQIKLPNGNIVNSSSSSYNVSKNGVYYFEVTDNVGNTTFKYIIVDKIDNEKPIVNITNNQNWNNGSSVPITITAYDN